MGASLSARRAWIEMACQVCVFCWVASLSARRAWIEIVLVGFTFDFLVSLSARRAWIEIKTSRQMNRPQHVALRKESVDRNTDTMLNA